MLAILIAFLDAFLSAQITITGVDPEGDWLAILRCAQAATVTRTYLDVATRLDIVNF